MIAKKHPFPCSDTRYPQYVLKLKDVYVTDRGLIVTSKGDIIPEANFAFMFWRNKESRYDSPNDQMRITHPTDMLTKPLNIKRVRINNAIHMLEENYIYGLSPWDCYVWGELWDSIAPLEKIERLKLDYPVLLCNPFTAHVKELSTHFSLFNYHKENIYHLKELKRNDNEIDEFSGSSYFFPTLYYSSPVGYPATYPKKSIEFMRQKYLTDADNINDQPDVRLYLDRLGDTRGVTNRTEVLRFCKKHNFIVVDGNETLSETISLFGRAQVIFGAHGSAFRNMLFCKRSPRIFEFCAHNRVNWAQKSMGETMNLNYIWEEVEADELFNIKIPLENINI